MRAGDLVRFREGTPIFKRQGETLAVITRIVELDEERIRYVYLLVNNGQIMVRRSEDIEVLNEAE
jgi:hypothetical protein